MIHRLHRRRRPRSLVIVIGLIGLIALAATGCATTIVPGPGAHRVAGVGHAADACLRSPPSQLDRIGARLGSARRQVVTVTGGPGRPGPPSLADCEGRSPHGYVEQENTVVEGIARFVRGGSY